MEAQGESENVSHDNNNSRDTENKNERPERGLSRRTSRRSRTSKVSKLDIESTYNLLDQEGVLSPPVLQESLSNLGIPVTPTECHNIYMEVTDNGTQDFDESSFKTWVETNCPEIEPDDITEEAFKTLDRDGDGFVTYEDLKHGLPPLGVSLSDQVLRIMFDEADTDHDGKLDSDDFYNAIEGS